MTESSDLALAPSYLLPAFRFQVTLTAAPGPVPTEEKKFNASEWNPSPLGKGGFSECSGLELETDVKEYLEGGRNDGVIRRVGRVKLSPIVLKRGMFAKDGKSRANADLWLWLTRTVSGELPVTRYNGRIEIQNAAGTRTMAVWTFERGLPLKVTGPTLNARTGEIAVEELHIAHEGLRMET
ncbi:phage tail protein [Demequina mangrovi]|uniref:phage tail protein n=1 Tax=Demequina mangrovi TaxID=1043493 RepID=UPI00191C3783|nr:phage tail protein [Demequina mangrovi]